MKSIRMTDTREWEEPTESAQMNIYWSNFHKIEPDQPQKMRLV